MPETPLHPGDTIRVSLRYADEVRTEARRAALDEAIAAIERWQEHCGAAIGLVLRDIEALRDKEPTP